MHTERHTLLQEETHTPQRERYIHTHTLRERNKLGERDTRSHTERDTQLRRRDTHTTYRERHLSTKNKAGSDIVYDG